jgi:hypothetical protein
MYTTSGRLMFQVTYPPPDPTRYVELDFSQQVTPGAPPLGDKLSCLQVSSSGETYGQPFAGPAVPQFLKGVDHRVRALYFRLSSDFEWFFDGGKWTTAKGRYLSLAAMPDNGAPRYFKGWISVDVAELEVNGAGPNLNLAFNGQGLNPIGDEGGYLKVVRYGQQWTITPVSAGEAGLSGGSTAHLSLSVQTPDKRNYTSRNGNCDLGTFNMPFSLTLTCDASRGSCPLPAGPVQ